MKVLLLAGGDSAEREVSLTSGSAVFEALSRLGHTVFAVDPVTGRSLLTSDNKFITGDGSDSGKIALVGNLEIRSVSNTISSPGFHDVDVIFLAMHGGLGENGTIQSLLDLAGKKYTGSCMVASAVAMDKALAKRLFSAEKIITPQWSKFHIRDENGIDTVVATIKERHPLPLIVKPNNSGSTIGLTKVTEASIIRPAVEAALRESKDVLIEEYIPGREMTVSVLDGEALPVVEILPLSGLYDYEAKYTKGKTNYSVPADIDEKIARQMQDAAKRAYIAVDASGLARVDFILTDDGQFFCLEINTIPGMTELSLSPMAARAAGIDFDHLVQRLIDSAMAD